MIEDLFTDPGDLGKSYSLANIAGRNYFGFDRVSDLLKVIRRDVKEIEKFKTVLCINIDWDSETDTTGAVVVYE